MDVKLSATTLVIDDVTYRFVTTGKRYGLNGKLRSCDVTVMRGAEKYGVATMRDGNPLHAYLWNARGPIGKLSRKTQLDLARAIMREKTK